MHIQPWMATMRATLSAITYCHTYVGQGLQKLFVFPYLRFYFNVETENLVSKADENIFSCWTN